MATQAMNQAAMPAHRMPSSCILAAPGLAGLSNPSTTPSQATKIPRKSNPSTVWFKKTLRSQVPIIAQVSPESRPVCGVK